MEMTHRLHDVTSNALGPQPLPRVEDAVNVSDAERWASVVGGGALAIYGMTRMQQHDRTGPLFALMGTLLAWRGISGHSHLYEGLHVSRFAGDGGAANVIDGQAIRVERTVRVQRPAAELYRFWRQLENLPRFMEHLESVLPLGGNRFHWTVRAPIGTVSWDAEIIGEREGEFLAWRSVDGSQIANAGSVHFTPRGAATDVRVSLAYQPPAGPLGALVARLFGEEPAQQVGDDLDPFREVMEGGSTIPGRRW